MEFDELPESWQKEIKNLRTEAANYRTKYSEINQKVPTYESALSDASKKFDELAAQAAAAQDEREKALAEREQALLEVIRRDAAIEAGIPKYASRLQGSTPEELAEDAKRFAEEIGARPSFPKDFAATQTAGDPPKPSGLQAAVDRALGISE